jgi:hypothetical protein
MPSVTFWNRLEPRPRSPDLAPALAARIRDPLWMLTRQWQLGEFRGEDAASPAWVRVEATLAPLADGGEGFLDAAMEAEPWTPDLSIRVELGQVLEDLLDERVSGIAALFRAAYPVEAAPEPDLRSDPDRAGARFRRVVGGRATDGVAVLDAALASLPSLPPRPAGIPHAQAEDVVDALLAFVDWVRAVYGEVGRRDAASWDPARLEYTASASVAGSPAAGVTLSVHPLRSGALDWTSFDVVAGEGEGEGEAPAPEPPERLALSLLPIQVRFRGMPNARFWDFESSTLDFGRLTPDRQDLAKLLVMDFMLVHGNDWFVAPLPMPAGRVCRVDTLVVQDVFGGATPVPRADVASSAASTPPTERWTMFSTTAASGGRSVADFFVLAPSAGPAYQAGAPLEDVRFIRDEMANMVWAVEHTLEGSAGGPLDGGERDQALQTAPPVSAPLPPPGAPPLRYRLQTRVPGHWIPFVPVLLDAQRGSIVLERAAMLRPDPQGGPAQGAGYRIFEEEVTRSGVRVLRVPIRGRLVDGTTRLWIARRKLAGRGEGSSGLEFDLGEPNS